MTAPDEHTTSAAANRSRPLRVAVVSKGTSDGGGASRVAEDLARQLNAVEGVQADHWIGYLYGPMQPHLRMLHSHGIYRKVYQAAQWTSRMLGAPDFLTPELVVLLRHGLRAYDVFHFHDISTAFSPLALRWLARRRPVAWTFHDLSPFTGGCFYPMACDRYRQSCGRCPQLDKYPLQSPIDLTGWMRRYKRRLARDGTITAVAPSHWMADEAERHGGWKRPRVIPYGVDHEIFRPQDRPTLRRVLRLEPDTFYVVVSAFLLEDDRKGIGFAVEALRRCGRPIGVILVGHSPERTQALLAGLEVRSTGFLSNKEHLALYYAAADAYLFPSLADNLPNSVLETMACGTPTIAFDVGGLAEMISHHEHGWLTPPRDVAGLIDGLQFAYDHRERWRACAEACRRKAVERYSPRQFCRSHLDLYADLLAAAGSPTRGAAGPSGAAHGSDTAD